MSKIIWKSETEQGIICQKHIVAIKSVSHAEHAYEMYDADCQTYKLSNAEFLQIADQIDHDEFIYLEGGGAKMWLNEEHFTDAICNAEGCEINGWSADPLVFAELMEYFEGKTRRKLAKKAAKIEYKAKTKTPAGIDELIEEKTKEHNDLMMELDKLKEKKGMLIIEPAIMQ